MESARRQTLWYLLRADTGDARRARQRLAVGTCLALFLAGLLAAVGLAVVVVAFGLLFAAAVALTAAVRALRRHRHRISRAARGFATAAMRAVRRYGDGMSSAASSFATASVRTGRRHGERISTATRRRAPEVQRALAQHGSRARQHAERVPGILAHSAERAAAGIRQIQVSPPRPIDLQREAFRLNAAGTNRRRDGEYAEAVELHTRALVLLRDVENPHAVALTQNNLALALSHVGDDRSAISLFEQAAATLDALGDKENEGKIMTNLALAHRRHGRADESADVLRLALTKLERDSSVYELVEAELRRAS
jgi:tetratricopeptide (TPR) repeat protein